MKVKKGIDLITMNEVCEIIGKKLRIDEELVRDVFQEYEKLYDYSVMNRKRLSLGRIGQFCFDYKKRKEVGEVRSTFERTGEVTANNIPKRKHVIKPLEVAIPSYCRSVFEVHKMKQDFVRKVTEEII